MLARARRIFAGICLVALACSLCACAAPQTTSSQTDSVSQNRQYMSALNQMSSELSEQLDGFVDAVSRNDTVGMRTQAENAFQTIDKMRDQDAPEDLGELKDGYLSACDNLEQALNDYIDLYEDVATSEQPISSSDYADRLKSIQDAYTSAAEQLEATDTKATELQK